MVPGATSAEAASASRALLDAVGLRSTTVVVSPSTITDETSLISVEVVPSGEQQLLDQSNVFQKLHRSQRSDFVLRTGRLLYNL